MTVEIKICGLSTAQTLEAACAGADLIGFIFFDKSPRNVAPQLAASLCGIARSHERAPGCVAVTVDAVDAFLDHIVATMKPDFLQLHGKETPGRVNEVRQRYGLPIIKAFSISAADDVGSLSAYEGLADRFLLDAKAPAGSGLPGGNGVSFDWSLLEGMQTDTPWMLSGGLDAENVASALRVSGASRIDVSSGVESSPGVKDVAKIDAFIKTVREACGG